MRVASGAIAKKFLKEKFSVEIRGYLTQLGPISAENIDFDQIDQNPFFCPDKSKVAEMEEYMSALSKEGNSIGAKIAIEASNVPAALGEPVYDRLDADIAIALSNTQGMQTFPRRVLAGTVTSTSGRTAISYSLCDGHSTRTTSITMENRSSGCGSIRVRTTCSSITRLTSTGESRVNLVSAR